MPCGKNKGVSGKKIHGRLVCIIGERSVRGVKPECGRSLRPANHNITPSIQIDGDECRNKDKLGGKEKKLCRWFTVAGE